VIALGDSFHDRDAHGRLSVTDRDAIAALQVRRDGSGSRATTIRRCRTISAARWPAKSPSGLLVFRHEPTAATGEIAGHLHPKARVATRGRSVERRCSRRWRAVVMPAFGAYTGGLSIRDIAFAEIFQTLGFVAHVLGDNRLHAIAASRCC